MFIFGVADRALGHAETERGSGSCQHTENISRLCQSQSLFESATGLSSRAGE